MLFILLVLPDGLGNWLLVPGGLFELVSCPHYLAEIIIYCGLLLMAEGAMLPLLMLIWVVSRLAPASVLQQAP